MEDLHTPLVLLVTASAVSAVLVMYGWKHRRAPGAMPFAVLMLFVAQWTLAYAFELGSTSLQGKILWANIKYFGVVIAPVAWLFFVLQYTRREHWLKARNIALFSVEPFITLLLVWTNDLHGLSLENDRFGIPWFVFDACLDLWCVVLGPRLLFLYAAFGRHNADPPRPHPLTTPLPKTDREPSGCGVRTMGRKCIISLRLEPLP